MTLCAVCELCDNLLRVGRRDSSLRWGGERERGKGQGDSCTASSDELLAFCSLSKGSNEQKERGVGRGKGPFGSKVWRLISESPQARAGMVGQ